MIQKEMQCNLHYGEARVDVLWLRLHCCVRLICIYRSYVSQRTKNPTIRLVRPAKTQTSLRIHAVWSESSLIAWAFYSLRAIQRGKNKNPGHKRMTYKLICVFVGHADLIVDFVVRWVPQDRNNAFPFMWLSLSKVSLLGRQFPVCKMTTVLQVFLSTLMSF